MPWPLSVNVSHFVAPVPARGRQGQFKSVSSRHSAGPGCRLEVKRVERLLWRIGRCDLSPSYVLCTVQPRPCKCPRLILEPRCVQTAGLVEAYDEVHPRDHLDRPTARKLNEDLRHAHALASQRRRGVVLRIAQQPLEDRVPQPDKPALVDNDEPAASDPHRARIDGIDVPAAVPARGGAKIQPKKQQYASASMTVSAAFRDLWTGLGS